MRSVLPLLLIASLSASAQTPNWSQVNDEAMRHFQALVQIDSTDPPGNETSRSFGADVDDIRSARTPRLRDRIAGFKALCVNDRVGLPNHPGRQIKFFISNRLYAKNGVGLQSPTS